VPTPPAGTTLAYVTERLAREAELPALGAAVGRQRVGDAGEELAGIVAEIYDVLARNRRGLKLIDRSARDLPELAAVWFTGARGGFLTLLRNISRCVCAAVSFARYRISPPRPVSSSS
jgi:hypothetical protein